MATIEPQECEGGTHVWATPQGELADTVGARLCLCKRHGEVWVHGERLIELEVVKGHVRATAMYHPRVGGLADIELADHLGDHATALEAAEGLVQAMYSVARVDRAAIEAGRADQLVELG